MMELLILETTVKYIKDKKIIQSSQLHQGEVVLDQTDSVMKWLAC